MLPTRGCVNPCSGVGRTSRAMVSPMLDEVEKVDQEAYLARLMV